MLSMWENSRLVTFFPYGKGYEYEDKEWTKLPHMKTLDRIGLLKMLPMEEEITGEVGPERGTKGLRIEQRLLMKGQEDLLVGQGTGMKGQIIQMKLAKKGPKHGVEKKLEE